MKKLFSILLTTVLISACTTKVSYLSVVVPNNQYFDNRALNLATVEKDVTGSDTHPIILFFPMGHPAFDEAIQDAIMNGHGNVMTNVTIIEEMRWWVLFGYNSIEVHGDVVSVAKTSRPKSGGKSK